MKDMQKVTCSMNIGGGDESDTQIVSYKRWKTTQPTIQSSARKMLTTLVPCTQEAYLVDNGEPIRFPELSQVGEGDIQEPKVDLASTKGKRPNPKARSAHVTTYAHGEGVGEDLKGTTNSSSSGNPPHCRMRTRLAHKLVWDVTKPLDDWDVTKSQHQQGLASPPPPPRLHCPLEMMRGESMVKYTQKVV